MTSYQPVLKHKKEHHYLPTVLGLLLVLLIVTIVYLTAAPGTTTPAELRNLLAVNPELKAVAQYENLLFAYNLSENPELISFQHYVAVQSKATERNTFAENPELMTYQNYLAANSDVRNELAVNPELSSYYRYINK